MSPAMRRAAGAVVALALLATTTGCEEQAAPEPPRPQSSRVAMTVTYPGQAPWALITYQGPEGERCSALGTLTGSGPRVLGALDAPLDVGLASHGRCLHGGVALDVTSGAGGEVRVIGGVAAHGVRRVVIGGERVRPGRSGAFLVTQPGDDDLGDEVELVFSGGGRERMALAAARRRS